MEQLFIYGTLKDQKVQQNILGKIISSIPDTLGGYIISSVKIDNQDYPVIDSSPVLEIF